MYNIVISRRSSDYIKPKFGFALGQKVVGQVWYTDSWVARSFETLPEAEKALGEIETWFKADGVKRLWYDTLNLYCDSGEGKTMDIYIGDRHIAYCAYIEEES